MRRQSISIVRTGNDVYIQSPTDFFHSALDYANRKIFLAKLGAGIIAGDDALFAGLRSLARSLGSAAQHSDRCLLISFSVRFAIGENEYLSKLFKLTGSCKALSGLETCDCDTHSACVSDELSCRCASDRITVIV